MRMETHNWPYCTTGSDWITKFFSLFDVRRCYARRYLRSGSRAWFARLMVGNNVASPSFLFHISLPLPLCFSLPYVVHVLYSFEISLSPFAFPLPFDHFDNFLILVFIIHYSVHTWYTRPRRGQWRSDLAWIWLLPRRLRVPTTCDSRVRAW
jgi:hypothetical protein